MIHEAYEVLAKLGLREVEVVAQSQLETIRLDRSKNMVERDLRDGLEHPQNSALLQQRVVR